MTEYSPTTVVTLGNIRLTFPNFQNHACCSKYAKDNKHNSPIWHENMLVYLSLDIMGAIHSTKISGNFGLKVNGSVRSNQKSFEKSGPPFEVDLFSRLDRSDRNGPFHLTIRPIFNPRTSLFGIFRVQNGGKYSSLCTLLRIVNSRSISVTRTSMYSYHRSVLHRKQSVCFGC